LTSQGFAGAPDQPPETYGNGLAHVPAGILWFDERRSSKHSETECVNSPIGGNIQTILDCDQRLKVTETTQWFTGIEWLAGIAAECMQSVVAFGAEDPDNRIGMSICRGRNWPAASAEAGVPSRIDRRR
jgi:hypothetical protein